MRSNTSVPEVKLVHSFSEDALLSSRLLRNCIDAESEFIALVLAITCGLALFAESGRSSVDAEVELIAVSAFTTV